MKTTTHKTTRKNIVLGIGLLGISAAMGVAQAAPRNNDVKQARKVVRQERKDVRRADTPAERRREQRDVQQARQRVQQERRENQRYNRPNNRPVWNNRPVTGPINVTGIVIGGNYRTTLTVRGDNGRNYVVQGNNSFDRRINVGDRVRVEGTLRNSSVFAQRVTLLENRR
jgi:hypothetical protein